MENENHIGTVDNSYNYLQKDEFQRHFADLNIELLRGGHIQDDNYYLFDLLRKFPNELNHYYKSFYNLELAKETKDNTTFYYLDFIGESKGRLSPTSRNKELSENQTIVGIMLLSMYYDRYFEKPKNIVFEDIKKEITDGEHSTLYKILLFKEKRESYSESEWGRVVKMLKSTIRDFEKMGWVKRLNSENPEGIAFTIKESIYRFQKLYENEIANFETFVNEYRKQKEE